MTFYTWLNIFNQCVQPWACVVKGNGAHKRDEVENNAVMSEDDAEKHDVLGCIAISLDKTDSSDGMQWQ